MAQTELVKTARRLPGKPNRFHPDKSMFPTCEHYILWKTYKTWGRTTPWWVTFCL